MRAPAQEFDPDVLPGQVKAWIEMVLQQAPEPHKSKLIELVKQLSLNGSQEWGEASAWLSLRAKGHSSAMIEPRRSPSDGSRQEAIAP
jgi:hypothetical protein